MNKTQSSFEAANKRAKRLRHIPTYTEQKAWSVLRALPDLPGRFRRQAPIGPFVVDFVCHAARLVVEIDGGVHSLPDVAARDLRRDDHLKAEGYTVLRIPTRLAADPDALAGLVREALARGAPG